MTCLRCRADNSPGRRFCGECGAPLALPCASCGFSSHERLDGAVRRMGMIVSKGEARCEDLHWARRGPSAPTAVRVTLAGSFPTTEKRVSR